MQNYYRILSVACNNLILFFSSSLRLILVSALSFALAFQFSKPNALKRSDYIAPPEIIKNLTVGLNVQMSDSFWLRALQDFEFCDTPINEKECSGKSWLFQIINVSVILDKNFFEAFYYGALALTIIISDYQGASVIFDKAVAQHPKTWKLLYAAGYHALVEEKDKLKAAKLYYEAAQSGAPDWVRMMAGKLAVDGGDDNYATQVLQGMIQINDQPDYIERLKKKLEQVKLTNE